MTKQYILDVNVLLRNPHCLYQFQDGTIIITQNVMDEIESASRNLNDQGLNARIFRVELMEGLNNKILTNVVFYRPTVPCKTTEESLLNACLEFKKTNDTVLLVTLDPHLSVLADANGLHSHLFIEPADTNSLTERYECALEEPHKGVFLEVLSNRKTNVVEVGLFQGYENAGSVCLRDNDIDRLIQQLLKFRKLNVSN